MRYAEFCSRQTSVIALGTMHFGGKTPEGQACDFMDAYLELGGNFIDTARIYGDFDGGVQGGSEQVIGRWMASDGRRDRVLLATKGAHPDPARMHAGRLSRAEVMDDLKRSLENLRTDHVDLYWLHRDDPARPVRDILETLTEAVEGGMAKYVGVSNWTSARIEAAMACSEEHGLARICANQPQFSLARQVIVEDDTLCQVDRETYALHRRRQLALVAFSSQAKGYFSKLAQGDSARLSDKVRRRYDSPENLEIFRRVQALSAMTGLSAGAISLAWLTSQPFPVFPIAGVSSLEQIEALREAGDARLTPEQAAFLRAL